MYLNNERLSSSVHEKLRLFSSSSFKYLKNASATALSYGLPDLENDWAKFFALNASRTTLDVYCVPRSL